jgi:peptidoglycan/LPS O-acetylase OafA/YrhL
LLHGDFGVTVFFFLSGFLIATLMRAEYDKNGSINLGHFWLRRALRILPPLYLVLLAFALMAWVVYPPRTVDGPALAAQLLFYANYWNIFGGYLPVPGSNVVWSLAVEEHFYLVFPLLYVAMRRYCPSRRHQAWLLWGLRAAVLAWRSFLVIAGHAPSSRILGASDTRIDSILLRMRVGRLEQPRSRRADSKAGSLEVPAAPACSDRVGRMRLFERQDFRAYLRFFCRRRSVDLGVHLCSAVS